MTLFHSRKLSPLVLVLLVAVFTAYFIFGNFGASQAASAPTRVVIGYPSPTPRVAPLWIAQDLDFFGKYGLTAQLVLVRNNQMLTAGLAAGDIDVGYTGGTTVLGAAAAGVELKLIASFVSRGRGYLIVRPDIKKPMDLAGKRVGVKASAERYGCTSCLPWNSSDWIRRETGFTCS